MSHLRSTIANAHYAEVMAMRRERPRAEFVRMQEIDERLAHLHEAYGGHEATSDPEPVDILALIAEHTVEDGS